MAAEGDRRGAAGGGSGAQLSIGALARAAGVHVETIRYYQRRGLLPQPARPLGGIRRYPRELVARLRFIKRAQALGFSLAEVAQLLALGEEREEGGAHCEDLRRRAEAKRAAVEERIRDLLRLRESLDALIAACQREGGPGHCPLVEALLAEGEGMGAADAEARPGRSGREGA